jgi:hypothetical protein
MLFQVILYIIQGHYILVRDPQIYGNQAINSFEQIIIVPFQVQY